MRGSPGLEVEDWVHQKLTARATEEDRKRCLAHGMDGFLTKPLQVVELLHDEIGGGVPRGERIGLAQAPLHVVSIFLHEAAPGDGQVEHLAPAGIAGRLRIITGR